MNSFLIHSEYFPLTAAIFYTIISDSAFPTICPRLLELLMERGGGTPDAGFEPATTGLTVLRNPTGHIKVQTITI